MIYVVVSDECPFCDRQLEIMQQSFFDDEYQIVKVGSDQARKLPSAPKVEAVPFVLVTGNRNDVIYAEPGVLDGTSLRKIDRRETGAFNLKRTREAQSVALA